MRRRHRHRRILRLLTWFGHTSPLDLALTLERVWVTDFYKATQAKDDETVIFSWVEYPDKETRDAANKKMSEASDTTR